MVGLLAAGCSSCGDGNAPQSLVIDHIEIRDYDPEYEALEPIQFQEDGLPDFYAEVWLGGGDLPYYTSEVVVEAALPAKIPFESLSFQGGELDQEVTLRIWEDDSSDPTISMPDIVGEVSFVPRDLTYGQEDSHRLSSQLLVVQVMLQW